MFGPVFFGLHFDFYKSVCNVAECARMFICNRFICSKFFRPKIQFLGTIFTIENEIVPNRVNAPNRDGCVIVSKIAVD